MGRGSTRRHGRAATILIFALLAPAHGGGFDKPNLASGKYTGIGGAAVSSVLGAESTLYNPAGLARSGGFQISANSAFGLGPTVEAPIKYDGTSLTRGAASATTEFTFPVLLGLYGSRNVGNNLGVGFGLFVAGGTGADYGSTDFLPNFPTLRPEVESLTGLIEASFGVGYEPSPGFRVGAAWRVVNVRSETRAGAPLDLDRDGVAEALLAGEFAGLSGTSFSGFRIGAQYAPEGAVWGLGASLRSSVGFTAKGESGGVFQTPGSTAITPVAGGRAEVTGTFPFQAAVGGHFKIVPELTMHAEYSYTLNTPNKQLRASGDPLVLTGIGTIPASAFTTQLNWRNQHQGRLGAQWKMESGTILRAGFIQTSQVVPHEWASPFFTPPGDGQTYSVGAGTRVPGEDIELDFSVEYDSNSGKVTNAELGTLNGTYEYRSWGLFLGMTKQF